MRVHLHTALRRRTPEGIVREVLLELAAGATLEDLLRAMAIEPEGLVLVVNGRVAGGGQVLCEADAVHLIPALSGG